MNLIDRINACAKLGEILRNPDSEKFHSFRTEISELRDLVVSSRQYNPWFTPENVKQAILSVGNSLRQLKIERWFDRYPKKTFENTNTKTIGVVMAGNIPMVGFHDYLSVMVTGNRFLGKLSSDDNRLLPLIHRILEKIEPAFRGKASFTDGRLNNFDAIIATGSNNTARYFEYYFGKYPHIIRKNRNGIAVITGNESAEQMAAFGKDIFSYYGLGCRNVSKIYIPEAFPIKQFFENIETFSGVALHHKYANNYDYNKSIFLVNSIKHFDNGFLLLKEDENLASPISVLYYEKYSKLESLKLKLLTLSEQIQCIATIDETIKNAVAPGKSQEPELWDYADGIDTIDFLKNLK